MNMIYLASVPSDAGKFLDISCARGNQGVAQEIRKGAERGTDMHIQRCHQAFVKSGLGAQARDYEISVLKESQQGDDFEFYLRRLPRG